MTLNSIDYGRDDDGPIVNWSSCYIWHFLYRCAKYTTQPKDLRTPDHHVLVELPVPLLFWEGAPLDFEVLNEEVSVRVGLGLLRHS